MIYKVISIPTKKNNEKAYIQSLSWRPPPPRKHIHPGKLTPPYTKQRTSCPSSTFSAPDDNRVLPALLPNMCRMLRTTEGWWDQPRAQLGCKGNQNYSGAEKKKRGGSNSLNTEVSELRQLRFLRRSRRATGTPHEWVICPESKGGGAPARSSSPTPPLVVYGSWVLRKNKQHQAAHSHRVKRKAGARQRVSYVQAPRRYIQQAKKKKYTQVYNWARLLARRRSWQPVHFSLSIRVAHTSLYEGGEWRAWEV